MKNTFNKVIYSIVILTCILSFCSCSSTLSKSKAEDLISAKFKLPHGDTLIFNVPIVKVWTQDWDWGDGGIYNYGCKNNCKPSLTIDEIIKSGKYSNMIGLSTKTRADLQKTYIAKGDFITYTKYKDLGLITFNSYIKGAYMCMTNSGVEASDSWDAPRGYYWNCNFSLTAKAKESGIVDWRYKADDWVLDSITGIFNDEASKTAKVEYTIKTANPSTTANLLGEWKETKMKLKANFKKYDDGWRIEE